MIFFWGLKQRDTLSTRRSLTRVLKEMFSMNMIIYIVIKYMYIGEKEQRSEEK